jgi:hypothetical protein
MQHSTEKKFEEYFKKYLSQNYLRRDESTLSYNIPALNVTCFGLGNVGT